MKIRHFLLLLVIALQLTACSKDLTTVNVTLSDYNYTPSTLTVPAGKEITLSFQADKANEWWGEYAFWGTMQVSTE